MRLVPVPQEQPCKYKGVDGEQGRGVLVSARAAQDLYSAFLDHQSSYDKRWTPEKKIF